MTALIPNDLLQSAVAVLAFALVFLVGGRLDPVANFLPDRRSLISFASGASSAYVFVYLMPELADVRHEFVESANMVLRYEGMAIYFIALLGFLVFYGLEHLRDSIDGIEENTKEGASGLYFKLHVGGFAAYVWLVSYLVVHLVEDSVSSILLYTIAMAFHFLATDHELREKHGQLYQNKGRFLLAAMAMVGWASGWVLPLPTVVVAMMTAFISGAVIMNSSLSELPSEKEGHFLPFIAGGIIYGLILIPL